MEPRRLRPAPAPVSVRHLLSRAAARSLGLGFYNYTPTPYTVTTGTDDYHTGLFNARPAGVPRNSLNGGSYQDVQISLNYSHKLHPKLRDDPTAVEFSLSSFNTLNRPNFEGYDGVITSPNFKQPTAANDPLFANCNSPPATPSNARP